MAFLCEGKAMKRKLLLLALTALLVSCGKARKNNNPPTPSQDVDEMEDIPEIVIEDDPFQPKNQRIS